MIPKLLAVSWIDVSIPLCAGLLLLACPQLIFKKTDCAQTDQARQAKARKWGAVLVVVAAIYFVTTSQG